MERKFFFGAFGVQYFRRVSVKVTVPPHGGGDCRGGVNPPPPPVMATNRHEQVNPPAAQRHGFCMHFVGRGQFRGSARRPGGGGA